MQNREDATLRCRLHARKTATANKVTLYLVVSRFLETGSFTRGKLVYKFKTERR